MANTNSWSFPNIFDVTTNKINILEDEKSVVNRTRLLILTENTELYNEPDFGVGLKRYLWQYNTPNVRAIIKDRIRDQVDINEPCVDASQMEFTDTLVATGGQSSTTQEHNKLKMSCILQTTFGSTAELNLDDEINMWDADKTSIINDTDQIALRDK